jgi:beta-glucosidase
MQMTDEERFSLLYSLYPTSPLGGSMDSRVPSEALPSSGYVRGVPHLGVSPLQLIGSSLGVLALSGESATAWSCTSIVRVIQ